MKTTTVLLTILSLLNQTNLSCMSFADLMQDGTQMEGIFSARGMNLQSFLEQLDIHH